LPNKSAFLVNKITSLRTVTLPNNKLIDKPEINNIIINVNNMIMFSLINIGTAITCHKLDITSDKNTSIKLYKITIASPLLPMNKLQIL